MGKLNKKKFRKAVVDSGGIISTIAHRCEVARNTVYKFVEHHPDMKDLIDDETERILDLAENKLFSKVSSGESWAIKYLLSTKGKKRGYIERSELGGPDNGQLEGPIIFKPSVNYLDDIEKGKYN